MIKYLITDPSFKYESFDDSDFICFRDKISTAIEIKAANFIKFALSKNIKNIFISEHIELAKKLKFNGVHLNSMQFDKISYSKSLGLKVIVSTHNDTQIEKAISEGADIVTYSPIFTTPNKGKPKGVKELKRVNKKYNIPIIALGGIISEKEVHEIKKCKIYGFASIRYFVRD